MMLKPLKTFLRVTKFASGSRYNVTNVNLENPVESGLGMQGLIPGFIPVYEENIARIWAHIKTHDEWLDLHPLERAMIVALYRTEKAIEAHQMEASMPKD